MTAPLGWLSERRICVIATIGSDGLPRAVPVELVVHDEAIWVWCRSTSVKARNVARTGSATIVSYKGNDWVQVRGAASGIDDSDPIYPFVSQQFLTKYDRTETWGNDLLIRVQPDAIGMRFH